MDIGFKASRIPPCSACCHGGARAAVAGPYYFVPRPLMVDSNVEFGIQYLPETVWAQDDFYPPGCAADQRISANTTVFEAIRQLDGNICGSRHRVVALIALLAPEPEPRPGGGPGDGNGDGGPGAGEAAAEDPADNDADADLELDADPADPIDSDHDRQRWKQCNRADGGL